jgi:hypothetical protein
MLLQLKLRSFLDSIAIQFDESNQSKHVFFAYILDFLANPAPDKRYEPDELDKLVFESTTHYPDQRPI